MHFFGSKVVHRRFVFFPHFIVKKKKKKTSIHIVSFMHNVLQMCWSKWPRCSLIFSFGRPIRGATQYSNWPKKIKITFISNTTESKKCIAPAFIWISIRYNNICIYMLELVFRGFFGTRFTDYNFKIHIIYTCIIHHILEYSLCRN